jgi:hypothetical protein
MNIIIPIVSAIMFWLGGRDQMKVPFNQKLFRWLGIGILIAIVGIFSGYGWVSLLSILTYFLATNVLSWGEKHWLRKLVGKYWQWVIYGFCLGLASFPVLGYWAILQGLVSAGACLGLMTWSNDGYHGHKLSHPYVELGIGFIGTIGCLWI